MIIQDFSLIKIFLQVSHEMSFSVAADKLGVSNSVISKKITHLEELLGTTLFQRTTRSIALTESGHKFLPLAETIINNLNEVDEIFSFKKSIQEISGHLRISSTETFAAACLAKIIPEFLKLHPKITIEMVLTNNVLNLVEENLDLSIRIYTPTDSSIIARKLFDNRLCLCATPEYLKQHKKIKTLEDLKHHQVLCLPPHKNIKFQKSRKKLSDVTMSANVTANSGTTLTELALNGVGLLLRSEWDLLELMAQGLLKEVKLNDEVDLAGSAYIIYPQAKYVPAKTKIFSQFLIERIKEWKKF